MEAFTGFIAALPYEFAPQGWVRCNGQSLPVSGNAPLYNLIGNTFGGDSNSFNVPDLRGRTIVGSTYTENGPGLGSYPQGQTGGLETVNLTINQIPQHSHGIIMLNPNLPVSGTITAQVNVNGESNADNKAPGNFLANATSGGENMYISSGGTSQLNPGTVTVSQNLSANLSDSNFLIGPTGLNQEHENRMPYLAIQYCICTSGVFPSRQ